MHAVIRVLIITAGLSLTLAGYTPAAQDVSAFRLQALNETGTRDGTCFVIRQETRADGTYLVLVTSARLFERETGRRARLFVGDTPIEIGAEAIATPYGNTSDIAVLHATVKSSPGTALPITFDRVAADTPFVISGFQNDGSPALVAQEVRFCATRTVLGNRATADLAGCQGAPAIVERGVFGIVSECGPDRVPEITPLSVSRNFLLRAVPGLGERSTETAGYGSKSVK